MWPTQIPKHIKAILFDLDGTLLDTETLSDQSMYLSIPGAPIPPPPNHRLPWELKQQILGLRGSDWAPIVLEYAKTHWKLPPDTLPTASELCQNWSENLNTLCPHVVACPGALELVEQLAQLNLPMAIATSSYQSMVDQKRKNHPKLFSHMQAIVCGDHANVKEGKPAPDIYLEAARQLHVDPRHCLVFEDALHGVQAGKAAGCCVVAVPDSRFDAQQLQVFAQTADVVLHNLRDFFSGQPFGEMDTL